MGTQLFATACAVEKLGSQLLQSGFVSNGMVTLKYYRAVRAQPVSCEAADYSAYSVWILPWRVKVVDTNQPLTACLLY